MIALISSTIYPPKSTADTQYRQSVPSEIRLLQTIRTIESLKQHNFHKIILFDNSGFNWRKEADDLLTGITVIKFNSYQFVNKGLSEIYMILSGLSELPDDVPIFKISGRDILDKEINGEHLKEHDFVGKICNDNRLVNTRGYYVKNKVILEEILLSALNYIYAYSHKIVGPRSLIRVVKNAFFLNLNKYNFYDPTISIEQGMYIALQNKFSVKHVNKLHVQGVLAGSLNAKEIVND